MRRSLPLAAALALSITCLAGVGATRGAVANSPDSTSAPGGGVLDPTSEERERIAKRIETKLIAPCCFTQPVATHYSPAADQVRSETRRLLAGGATEQEVLEAYVAKYGEQILAQPRARGFGLLAWMVPPLALFSATVGLILTLRHWIRQTATASVETEPATETNRDDSYLERLRSDIQQFDR